MLVHISQQRNERIPGLLYTGTGADQSVGLTHPTLSRLRPCLPARPGTAGMATDADARLGLIGYATGVSQETLNDDGDGDGDGGAASDERPLLAAPPAASVGAPDDDIELQPLRAGAASERAAEAGATSAAEVKASDVDEDEQTGVQLGLGDFIFYSVMVARASLRDWSTVVAVAVAAITVRLQDRRQELLDTPIYVRSIVRALFCAADRGSA